MGMFLGASFFGVMLFAVFLYAVLFRVVCSAVVCGEISCFITEVLILYCSVVGAVGGFLSVEQWACFWGPLHISLKCSFVIMLPI